MCHSSCHIPYPVLSTVQHTHAAEARLAETGVQESATEVLIAHFNLQIARLRREQYGVSAERSRRLLEQMELRLKDLEADAQAMAT